MQKSLFPVTGGEMLEQCFYFLSPFFKPKVSTHIINSKTMKSLCGRYQVLALNKNRIDKVESDPGNFVWQVGYCKLCFGVTDDELGKMKSQLTNEIIQREKYLTQMEEAYNSSGKALVFYQNGVPKQHADIIAERMRIDQLKKKRNEL